MYCATVVESVDIDEISYKVCYYRLCRKLQPSLLPSSVMAPFVTLLLKAVLLSCAAQTTPASPLETLGGRSSLFESRLPTL